MLSSKTEETYLALMEKSLSNEHYNIIRKTRSLKDDAYTSIIKEYIKQGPSQFNLHILIENIKQFAKSY